MEHIPETSIYILRQHCTAWHAYDPAAGATKTFARQKTRIIVTAVADQVRPIQTAAKINTNIGKCDSSLSRTLIIWKLTRLRSPLASGSHLRFLPGAAGVGYKDQTAIFRLSF